MATFLRTHVRPPRQPFDTTGLVEVDIACDDCKAQTDENGRCWVPRWGGPCETCGKDC